MNRALAAAVAAVAVTAAVATLALAGCAGGPSRGPAQALRWQPCPHQVSTVPGMRCGQLRVPLDYQRPNGRKITLALSEVPATAPPSQRQGVLLVNPGGPGAPGLSLAATVASGLPPAVAADYDIVGFDTRGVGLSEPELVCDPSFFSREQPDFVPANQAAEQPLIARAKAYAADCERKFGWLLPYMSTEDLARDMDSIRTALGQRQINYFGYSYGTYLGQVYATMFPHRLRRMVLDSIVNPDGVWWADNISQDYAFQGRMDAFFGWVAGYDSYYHLGSTQAEVTAAWDRAMTRLLAHPIDGPSGPLVGPDELSNTFLVGGYSNSYWPYLATALADYLNHGQTGPLVSLYQQAGQQSENEFAVYNAVECSDVDWPRSWTMWNTDNAKVSAAAPYETWPNAWFNASCAFWPVKGPAKPIRVGAAGLPPILMLQGTLDAATPYQGALVARRLFPSARMVVVEGGGNHGQSLASPPNTCVNGYLSRYLADGSLPERPGLVNATCPALPPPAP
jgi:pimeloyl-ACP methyl ester carboxylesterase